MDTIINVQLFQQSPRLVVVRLANRSMLRRPQPMPRVYKKNLETIRHGPAVALRLTATVLWQ